MNLTSENLPENWINNSGSPTATSIINEEYGGEGGQVVPDATSVVVTTGDENIFQKAFNWVVGGLKAIWRSIKGFFNMGALIRWGVGVTQRIWNFDWNITDAAIKKQQKDNIAGLADTWGEALGSMVGTSCGFGLGRIALANQPDSVKFDPEMIAKLEELRLNNFDEDSELWEEAVENLKTALTSTARMVGNNLAMEGFLNVRKLIKVSSKGLNLSAIAPNLASNIAKWGEEGQEPWSFASAQEAFVESLQEGWFKNFAESFLEAAQEMCGESLIQVSHLYG
jgi:hypothetical protein